MCIYGDLLDCIKTYTVKDKHHAYTNRRCSFKKEYVLHTINKRSIIMVAGIFELRHGHWVPRHYQDPSALVFSFNNATVPINPDYRNLGMDMTNCLFDPTLDGDFRLGAIRTNFDIGNTIAYNQNPNNIYPFNVDISGII